MLCPCINWYPPLRGKVCSVTKIACPLEQANDYRFGVRSLGWSEPELETGDD